jgi:predicted nuclease of restriction endonuclease-like RecB superfamily
MRLALADVKKTILRRAGEAHLTPYLLRPEERRDALAALIALYEERLGSTRDEWPTDRTAELLGDYRLARGLETCLAEWYEWRSPAWPDLPALAARAIASPSALRLALFDHVNEVHGGYLRGAEREQALAAFATPFGLTPARLEELLWLDSEHRAVLTRAAAATPTVAELAWRYNQRVIEAVLASASQVAWQIPVEPAGSGADGAGTLVKRACFLARRMGVQYELAFAETEQMAAEPALARVAEAPATYRTPGPVPLPERPRAPLCLTLYGPQERTGAPNQYGERLARLCRALLGYRRPPAAAARAVLTGPRLQGVATVYLHGRPLRFTLDERLLKLLEPAADAALALTDTDSQATSPAFDSTLEQALYQEFAALARAGEAHGWQLEREPEPVILGTTILVPDFALSRDEQRIYLEIAGYWRPEYRERKVRKLLAVRDHVPMVVAAPESASTAFAPLVGQVPVLWYRSHLSPHALLALVERTWDTRAARLAAVDAAAVYTEVERVGRIPPERSVALLHSYSRDETAAALARLAAYAAEHGLRAPCWLEDLGLCAAGWLDGLLEALRAAAQTATDQRLPLESLHLGVEQHAPELRGIPAAGLERLAERAGLTVVRSSIFEAYVMAGDAPPTPSAAGSTPPRARPRTQPRRDAGRTQTRASYSTQSMFPSEQDEPGNTEPEPPAQTSDAQVKEAPRGR